jgi:hypothetical protein
MRRGAALSVVLGLLLALFAPGLLSPVGADPANPVADENQFVALLNATRARGGLPPLTVDPELTALARDWAAHMAAGQCSDGKHICHANPISAGVTEPWLKLGENVGTGPSVGPVMDAFIASAGHYANIMDPAFTRVGVGVVWSGTVLYTTHRFMKVVGETAGAAPAVEAAPGDETPAPEPSLPPTTRRPRSTTTTTAPSPAPQAPPPTSPPAPPPPAAPSRVAVVLLSLHAMSL